MAIYNVVKEITSKYLVQVEAESRNEAIEKTEMHLMAFVSKSVRHYVPRLIKPNSALAETIDLYDMIPSERGIIRRETNKL